MRRRNSTSPFRVATCSRRRSKTTSNPVCSSCAQPLIQISIQLLLEVPFHPGDQCPKLMDDSIQLTDGVFRHSAEATHVMRFEFFYGDIHKGKMGQDRSRSRNIRWQGFMCCHASEWINCDRRRLM